MAADTAAPKPDFRAVEIEYRLRAPKERPAIKPAPARVAQGPPLELLLDPEYSSRAAAPLFWKLPEGDAVEVPFRDPAELQLSLEFEYVLGGPAAVDRLVRQLDVAALRAIARDPANPTGETSPELRGQLIINEVRSHPALFARIQVQMLVMPWDVIEHDEAAAWTSDVSLQLSPPAHKKFILEANDAVSEALAAVQEKARAALRDVEEVAKGMLLTALDSARNEIFREGFRYFEFQDPRGLEAAFKSVNAPYAKSEKREGAKKAAEIKTAPLTKSSTLLQEKVKALKPLAEELVKAEKAFNKEETTVYLADRVPIANLLKATEALDKARQTLAREVGKLREIHPVVLRMSADEIIRTPTANREELGRILFPILARAWKRNLTVKDKVVKWPLTSAKLEEAGWPKDALADRLKSDSSIGSVWRHRKYVERAVARVCPDSATVEHAAAMGVLSALHPKSPFLDMAAIFIRDLAIFNVAGRIDKAAASGVGMNAAQSAAEMGAKKLPRLVPVLNWVFAGYDIYAAIRDYGEQGDFFYCTLDPTDALTELKPSLGGLLGEIGLQVAFALV